LSIRGFGTVGLARSSSDHAEFVRDLSQPVGIKGGQWSGRIDSIFGLQANWRATQEFELVGQVVSRLHYDRSHSPELMWAFAKWDPDPRFSFRAGRIGADFMMLADSRLVGYSYLTVRPPADFFGPLFFSHFDGADASGTLPLGDGLMRGKLFAGKTREQAAGSLGVWNTRGSSVGGIVLDYVKGNWQYKLNISRILFSENMNTAYLSEPLYSLGSIFPEAIVAANTLRIKGTKARFLSFGMVYDEGPFQVQGMLNYIRYEPEAFQDSRSGYLLAGYRIGKLTPYAGISWWKTMSSDDLPAIPLTALNEAYRQFVLGSNVDRTTLTIGSRFDLTNNVAFKFQWDVVRASSDTWLSVRNRDVQWNGKTDVLSFTLDFVF
jgi:hypothetical protein